jgi:methylenetetrahydrofolate--tRNA-(uracil-5-)-methyltransferase
LHDDVVTVVGGGLAGSEAAWQLAQRGHRVALHEMRPVRQTPAHRTDRLAELVCSNTFKSTELSTAHGAIKAEMRELGCLVLECADIARVAAGTALAVDRDVFAAAVTQRIQSHPNITVVRGEVGEMPGSPAVIATGPLTGDALAQSLRQRLGSDALAFYDAIAPVVSRESIDEAIVFTASRYDKETMEGADDDGAYLNCPMTEHEYNAFSEMNSRGRETLRFGPLKPVGLTDPRTGRRPHAVVQLRREDRAGRLWNLVGFQTRLRIPEQQRVFRMIPGLASAEFLRYGSIHRNSYVNSPAVLTPALTLRDDSQIFLAGQITGVEGYTESTASGLLAGMNLSRVMNGLEPIVPPGTTMLGALYRYLREADPRHFQPMNANFGLVDDLDERVRDKRLKKERMAERAVREMRAWRDEMSIDPVAALA